MVTCAASSVTSPGGGAAAAAISAALHFFAASQCLINESWPRAANITNGTHFDFIVVGAGTAGSTLAARLAQFNYQVLLVEAGGNPPQEAVIPGLRHALKGSPYDWNFTTVNDGITSQGLRNGVQLQPRGKLLGGTGSFNDMVYSRGHPADYYEWSKIVGNLWNWTDVLEFFKKTEHMIDVNIINNKELMEFHGKNGGIEVSSVTEPSDYISKFIEAFNELGFNVSDDMTYPNKIGAGRFSHTIKNGQRSSSLTALLNNASTNLKLLKHTFVKKILINNNTAIGISATWNGQELEYYADKEVIISAGTFNTPKLMMLSGLGPKDHLEDLNIEVVKDLPVGNNFHDHVMMLNYLAVKNRTCTVNEPTQHFEMIKYLYNYSGDYSQSDSMGVYIPRKEGDPNIPHFAIYPSCMPLSAFTLEQCFSILGYNEEVCTELLKVNKDNELISLAIVLLKPQSRGKVRLDSTDPNQDPLIYAETFNNDTDYEGYSNAIRVGLSLVNTTYFKAIGARVLDFTCSNCSNLEENEARIRCMLKNFAMPAWHAVGTAAMGTVVDEKLKVLGIEGLRVVDASAMPTVIRGNTNAAVVMIAERAADFMKDVYPPKDSPIPETPLEISDKYIRKKKLPDLTNSTESTLPAELIKELGKSTDSTKGALSEELSKILPNPTGNTGNALVLEQLKKLPVSADGTETTSLVELSEKVPVSTDTTESTLLEEIIKKLPISIDSTQNTLLEEITIKLSSKSTLLEKLTK